MQHYNEHYNMYIENYLKETETWAIITGATDGIGLEFARQLGKMGFHIFFIGRNKEKCENVKKELSEYAKVDYEVLDLTKTIPKNVIQKLKDLQPTVLVNNAGMSYEHAKYLEELDIAKINKLLQLNCNTMTQLTHTLLPVFKEQNLGLVVCLGSGTSRLSCGSPLYTVYGASKAYVEYFCKSLYYELLDYSGVDVTCVIPYMVATKMSRRRPAWDVPTPKTYVESFFNQSISMFSIPSWAHWIQDLIYSRFPISSFVLKEHKRIRKKALNKKKSM